MSAGTVIPVEEYLRTSYRVLCVEILSRDDTLRSIHQRIEDYLQMGVPTVWGIDPEPQRAYMYKRGMQMQAVTDGTLRAGNGDYSPIELALADLFRD
jgi:Uma2 family endonuclease